MAMRIKKPNILIKGYPSYISTLLGNRGITTKEDADFFMYAGYDDLKDPINIKGLKEAVDLTISHIQKGSNIRVYADYDCDGVTSGSILDEGLNVAGATYKIDFPCRINDGYGITLTAIKRLISEGVQLIITVDNGIRANEPIKYAIERGVDVIVLDHHIVGSELPPANVVVDLHRSDETFEYKDFCGAGVAWQFIRLLYKTLGIEDEKCKSLLDLVAIGTIADVMPLTGENRILVKEGLKLINSKDYSRKGILAIIRSNFLTGHVTSKNVGFIIAPVINAPGRLLEHGAERAYQMVMDKNNNAIEEAEFLMRINDERKELTVDGVDAAKDYLTYNAMLDDNIFVANLEEQPEGIIGLISGRITEEYYKPSLVFTNNSETTLKASGRSTPNIDLYLCLSSCGGLFLGYGGHEQAAGMSIKSDNLDALREGLNLFIEDNYSKDVFIRDEYFEIEVAEEEITSEFMKKLDMIEPCGAGNPSPIIKIKEFGLVSKPVGNNFQKFSIIGKKKDSVCLYGNSIEALCFGKADLYNNLNQPTLLNVYGTLERDYSYGVEQIKILGETFDIPKTTSSATIDNNLLSQINDLASLL